MDVTFLAPVLDAAGPRATVCADVTHVSGSADTELELRVPAIGAELTAQGATGPVVEAPLRTQVETLVLADQPDDEQLLVGSSPLELGVSAGDTGALGVRDGQQVPGELTLRRAAVGSDAAVAAVLRHTDASTPS